MASGPALLAYAAYDNLFFVLVVGFVGGLAMVWDGFSTWRKSRLVEDTPRERVRSVAAGRTELQGTVLPIDDTRSAPFSDDEYLLARWEVEAYRSDDDGKSWVTVEEELDWVPFELHDGTDAIRIDPAPDGTIEIEEGLRTQIEVGRLDAEPAPVREYLRERSDVALPDRSGVTGSLFSEKRRYTQSIVPPGETCYVLGAAQPEPVADGGEELVLGEDEASETFILSTKRESELVSTFRWRSPAELVGGLCLSAVCLFLLLTLYTGL